MKGDDKKSTTMKATELKQGDWVRSHRDGYIRTVTGTRENIVFSNGWCFQEEDLEPVKLSVYILDHNADSIVAPHTEWLFVLADERKLSVKTADGVHFVVKAAYTDAPQIINYVHELQHTLWAMDINDKHFQD